MERRRRRKPAANLSRVRLCRACVYAGGGGGRAQGADAAGGEPYFGRPVTWRIDSLGADAAGAVPYFEGPWSLLEPSRSRLGTFLQVPYFGGPPGCGGVDRRGGGGGGAGGA